MKNKKIKFLGFFLVFFLVFSFSGCGCKKQEVAGYKINLEIWGVFDDQDDYSDIFENYRKINPQIELITYRKLSPDTYKKDILEALAAGKGPDIFLIHNTWLPNFEDKLVSSPEEIVNRQIVEKELVDTVARDFVSSENKVYALPLSVDSLALFYNKDILNRSGIVAPPQNWKEFENYASQMTQINQSGIITQSGASMGTAYNINRSTDILNLLFFQYREGGSYEGVSSANGLNISSPQEEMALKFFTQFSDSGSPFYSWNPRMHYSIDAFSEGSLAMMLNYSWQIETLKSKSPKLNFGVAPIPQLDEERKITYANYWGYAVSKNKTIVQRENSKNRLPTQAERIKESWNFIKYLTLARSSGENSFDPAVSYLEKTKKPAARRDLIQKQKDDIDLGVFALSNLYAKSLVWFDPEKTEIILAETIDRIVKGEISYKEALLSAEIKINKLLP